MPRVMLPARTDLSPAAREVYDQTFAGRRGAVPANVQIWLRSPEFASRAQRLGEFARYDTTLGPRRSELAILVVARHWTSQYEWAVHAKEAAKAGVPAATIADIAARRPPAFDDERDRVVYEFSSALVVSHHVAPAIYARAIELLGEQTTVELVGVLGYYTLVAMTLNTFDVEPPDGAPPLAP